MTRQETGEIMNILVAAYPKFYTGQGAPDPKKAINVWAAMFADDSLTDVAAAVKTLICTNTFPPSISEVKSRILQLREPRTMTEQEAWGMVSRALRNSSYNSNEEFAKFPPEIKRVVGNATQLREWAMMDADTVQSVVASNFQRSYRSVARQEAEIKSVPSDIRALMESFSESLSLEAPRRDLKSEVRKLPERGAETAAPKTDAEWLLRAAKLREIHEQKREGTIGEAGNEGIF